MLLRLVFIGKSLCHRPNNTSVSTLCSGSPSTSTSQSSTPILSVRFPTAPMSSSTDPIQQSRCEADTWQTDNLLTPSTRLSGRQSLKRGGSINSSLGMSAARKSRTNPIRSALQFSRSTSQSEDLEVSSVSVYHQARLCSMRRADGVDGPLRR